MLVHPEIKLLPVCYQEVESQILPEARKLLMEHNTLPRHIMTSLCVTYSKW